MSFDRKTNLHSDIEREAIDKNYCKPTEMFYQEWGP